VEVETRVPRLLAVELTSARFRGLASAAAWMLWVIVVTGATVRLTASGLGCRHWPGCQPGNPFPEKGYHSWVEFSNRMVASVTIVVTLVAWLGARLVAGLPRWVRLLALATFLGTLAQAPLGAVTVYTDLNPWLVLTHLLLSLAVLAAGVVVAVEAVRLDEGATGPYLPQPVRRLGLALAAACLVLVVSGTLVTAAGPHPGGTAVRRLGSFQPAVELHVRVTAVFGLAVLALLVYLVRNRSRWPGLVRAYLALLGLLVVQMAVGETQYRTELPWWLVLVHVSLAAAVWAAVVAVVTLFWRPVRAVAPARLD
jgi:cytochrome c oxidase assembly protein subunit 15